MKVSLAAASEAMDARVAGEIPHAAITSFQTDSRSLAPGALFFALRGEVHDGHDFVASAVERGAAAVVVDHPVDTPCVQLVVADTLKALQSLARWARSKWNGQVVGVTGSAGKTTTKDAIAAVLATALRVGKTQGNFNNHVGVPLSVLQVPQDAEVAVLEIGMNHAGEIRDLARIAQPGIGVVTNVGTAHIENFDSVEGVARAKRELIEALPPSGIAILNSDDPRVAAFASIHPGRTITYGHSSRATVRAEEDSFDADGSRFHLAGVGDFHVGLPGRTGIMTALAALAVAKAFEIPLESLKETVAALAPGKMRLERIQHAGMILWNDCYNSNPEAAEMMLDLLQRTPARRRIAVLGEMLELGAFSSALHAEVGAYAAQSGVDFLLGIRGAAKQLVDSAIAAGLPRSSALFFEDPAQAGCHLKSIAAEGDAILFKGSRGTRVEIALEEFLH